MKYEPLPKWFKYTEFRAFLREAEVDGREFQDPNSQHLCSLCDFAREKAPIASLLFFSAYFKIKDFDINGVYYKTPLWATRYQEASIKDYKRKCQKVFELLGSTPGEYPPFTAKEALDILCETGAFAK